VFHFWGQDIKTHTAECLKAIEESIWEDKISNTELPELTEGDVF
jgi:DNA mismatch endonuclease (patch repair protein)